MLFFKGLKPSDVISFFDEVNEQTERIKMFFSTSDCIPQVTVRLPLFFMVYFYTKLQVYLDEINTSTCMGLFKEIVVDRTIDGKVRIMCNGNIINIDLFLYSHYQTMCSLLLLVIL